MSPAHQNGSTLWLLAFSQRGRQSLDFSIVRGRDYHCPYAQPVGTCDAGKYVQSKSVDRCPANLAAPAPRASNGKPDLSGVWQAHGSQPGETLRLLGGAADLVDPGVDLQTVSKYFLNILADFKPEEEPMRPEAAALFAQRTQTHGKDIPTSHCLPGGVPFSTLIAPFKMIQTPTEMVLLLEDNNPPRQIYTDGRKLPGTPEPSWRISGTWMLK